MKKITRIDFNYHQTGSSDPNMGMDQCFETHRVGSSAGIKQITEHPAAGEGDKWYYDVYFNDGRMERIFNPNRVYFN